MVQFAACALSEGRPETSLSRPLRLAVHADSYWMSAVALRLPENVSDSDSTPLGRLQRYQDEGVVTLRVGAKYKLVHIVTVSRGYLFRIAAPSHNSLMRSPVLILVPL